MRKRPIINFSAVGLLVVAMFLTVLIKHEEATRDTWAEANALRAKQDCVAAGGTWVSHGDASVEYCDVGHIGIPSR